LSVFSTSKRWKFCTFAQNRKSIDDEKTTINDDMPCHNGLYESVGPAMDGNVGYGYADDGRERPHTDRIDGV
jgi:hypothetical protein